MKILFLAVLMGVSLPAIAGPFESHLYCTKVGEVAHYAMQLRQQDIGVSENKQLVYKRFKDSIQDKDALVYFHLAVDEAYQEPNEYKIDNKIKKIMEHEKLFYQACINEQNAKVLKN